MTYMKERLYQFWIVFGILFTLEIFLFTVRGSLWLGIYMAVTVMSGWILITWIEFYKMKRYFNDVMECMEQLDQKYLIAEMLKKGGRQEEVLNRKLFQDAGKSMAERVNHYKFSNEEYKEYIELWIHEVKIPIAAGKLIVENHRDKVTEDIEEELDKIEAYTEQALFYARSGYVEKDYLINSIKLSEVVNPVVIHNKKILIRKKARMDLHDLEIEVFSDSKWLVFILNQIISNSIKYADKESLELEIYAKEEKEAVCLFIRDNGEGISPEEVGRVFEKGFTGKKGRKLSAGVELSGSGYRNKATGIGLYLCRELCKKLGHGITIESEEGVGTTVCITFPRGSITSTALHN